MKFSLRIWSHLLKKSLMENFIFVQFPTLTKYSHLNISIHGRNRRIYGTDKTRILKDFMKLLQILPKTIIQSNEFFPKLTVVTLIRMRYFSNIFKHVQGLSKFLYWTKRKIKSYHGFYSKYFLVSFFQCI